MNVICSWNVANSFIKKSFEERIYITPQKLNYLIYLLYSDYLFQTGEKLFNEEFIKTDKGPVLPNVEFKFGCFKNNVITEYATDAVGKIFVVSSSFFEERLSLIWNRHKNVSDMEILNFINSTSTILEKENGDYLTDVEILDDEVKRNALSLEKAKLYRKKYMGGK